MNKIYVQTEGECGWSLERKNDSDLTYYEEEEVKQLLREVFFNALHKLIGYSD